MTDSLIYFLPTLSVEPDLTKMTGATNQQTGSQTGSTNQQSRIVSHVANSDKTSLPNEDSATDAFLQNQIPHEIILKLNSNDKYFTGC